MPQPFSGSRARMHSNTGSSPSAEKVRVGRRVRQDRELEFCNTCGILTHPAAGSTRRRILEDRHTRARGKGSSAL